MSTSRLPSPTAAAQIFLAFDFGHERTGVAIGNRISASARPLCTVHANAQTRLAKITPLVHEWQPDAFVIGLPLHPNGDAHDMTRSAEKFARQLAHHFGKPIALVDERYSSVEAAQAGARDIDSYAACLILERYFLEHYA